jgi:hypothetical protein
MADINYEALYKLLLSPNEDERSIGQKASAKLTPEEQQQFFDFQKVQTKGRGEANRPDASIGGVPSELAVAAPMMAARFGAGPLLKRAGIGAALGGAEGFIRSGGSPKTALQDAAMGALTGGGVPTLQKYLKGAVGDIAGEAGRAYEAGRRTAQAPSIFKVPQAGLGKMLTGDASGEAIKSIEDAALRNQLLHEMRAR